MGAKTMPATMPTGMSRKKCRKLLSKPRRN